MFILVNVYANIFDHCTTYENNNLWQTSINTTITNAYPTASRRYHQVSLASIERNASKNSWRQFGSGAAANLSTGLRGFPMTLGHFITLWIHSVVINFSKKHGHFDGIAHFQTDPYWVSSTWVGTWAEFSHIQMERTGFGICLPNKATDLQTYPKHGSTW